MSLKRFLSVLLLGLIVVSLVASLAPALVTAQEQAAFMVYTLITTPGGEVYFVFNRTAPGVVEPIKSAPHLIFWLSKNGYTIVTEGDIMLTEAVVGAQAIIYGSLLVPLDVEEGWYFVKVSTSPRHGDPAIVAPRAVYVTRDVHQFIHITNTDLAYYDELLGVLQNDFTLTLDLTSLEAILSLFKYDLKGKNFKVLLLQDGKEVFTAIAGTINVTTATSDILKDATIKLVGNYTLIATGLIKDFSLPSEYLKGIGVFDGVPVAYAPFGIHATVYGKEYMLEGAYIEKNNMIGVVQRLFREVEISIVPDYELRIYPVAIVKAVDPTVAGPLTALNPKDRVTVELRNFDDKLTKVRVAFILDDVVFSETEVATTITNGAAFLDIELPMLPYGGRTFLLVARGAGWNGYAVFDKANYLTVAPFFAAFAFDNFGSMLPPTLVPGEYLLIRGYGFAKEDLVFKLVVNGEEYQLEVIAGPLWSEQTGEFAAIVQIPGTASIPHDSVVTLVVEGTEDNVSQIRERAQYGLPVNATASVEGTVTIDGITVPVKETGQLTVTMLERGYRVYFKSLTLEANVTLRVVKPNAYLATGYVRIGIHTFTIGPDAQLNVTLGFGALSLRYKGVAYTGSGFLAHVGIDTYRLVFEATDGTRTIKTDLILTAPLGYPRVYIEPQPVLVSLDDAYIQLPALVIRYPSAAFWLPEELRSVGFVEVIGFAPGTTITVSLDGFTLAEETLPTGYLGAVLPMPDRIACGAYTLKVDGITSVTTVRVCATSALLLDTSVLAFTYLPVKRADTAYLPQPLVVSLVAHGLPAHTEFEIYLSGKPLGKVTTDGYGSFEFAVDLPQLVTMPGSYQLTVVRGNMTVFTYTIVIGKTVLVAAFDNSGSPAIAPTYVPGEYLFVRGFGFAMEELVFYIEVGGERYELIVHGILWGNERFSAIVQIPGDIMIPDGATVKLIIANAAGQELYTITGVVAYGLVRVYVNPKPVIASLDDAYIQLPALVIRYPGAAFWLPEELRSVGFVEVIGFAPGTTVTVSLNGFVLAVETLPTGYLAIVLPMPDRIACGPYTLEADGVASVTTIRVCATSALLLDTSVLAFTYLPVKRADTAYLPQPLVVSLVAHGLPAHTEFEIYLNGLLLDVVVTDDYGSFELAVDLPQLVTMPGSYQLTVVRGNMTVFAYEIVIGKTVLVEAFDNYGLPTIAPPTYVPGEYLFVRGFGFAMEELVFYIEVGGERYELIVHGILWGNERFSAIVQIPGDIMIPDGATVKLIIANAAGQELYTLPGIVAYGTIRVYVEPKPVIIDLDYARIELPELLVRYPGAAFWLPEELRSVGFVEVIGFAPGTTVTVSLNGFVLAVETLPTGYLAIVLPMPEEIPSWDYYVLVDTAYSATIIYVMPTLAIIDPFDPTQYYLYAPDKTVLAVSLPYARPITIVGYGFGAEEPVYIIVFRLGEFLPRYFDVVVASELGSFTYTVPLNLIADRGGVYRIVVLGVEQFDILVTVHELPPVSVKVAVAPAQFADLPVNVWALVTIGGQPVDPAGYDVIVEGYVVYFTGTGYVTIPLTFTYTGIPGLFHAVFTPGDELKGTNAAVLVTARVLVDPLAPELRAVDIASFVVPPVSYAELVAAFEAINAKLDEVIFRLDDVSVKIEVAREEILLVLDVIVANLADLSLKLSQVNQTLAMEIAKVAGRIEYYGELLAKGQMEIKDALALISRDLKALASALEDFDKRTSARLDAIAARIDELSRDIASRLEGLARLVSDSTAAIRTDIALVSSKIDSLTSIVAGIQADVATIKTDTSAIRATVSTIDARTSRMETTLANVNTRVEAISTAIAGLATKTDVAQARDTIVARVTDTIRTVESARDTIMNKLENVHQTAETAAGTRTLVIANLILTILVLALLAYSIFARKG